MPPITPIPTRAQVMDALYARIDCGVRGIPGPGIDLGFKSSYRRLPPYEQLLPEIQPAIIQTLYAEQSAHEGRGLDVRRTYHVQWTIFARCPDLQTSGDVVLDPLLDALMFNALAPDVGENFCTLGGLVNRAWIEGKIERDPGDLTNQISCAVPIMILVP